MKRVVKPKLIGFAKIVLKFNKKIIEIAIETQKVMSFLMEIGGLALISAVIAMRQG